MIFVDGTENQDNQLKVQSAEGTDKTATRQDASHHLKQTCSDPSDSSQDADANQKKAHSESDIASPEKNKSG
jgi:hypothetical protein